MNAFNQKLALSLLFFCVSEASFCIPFREYEKKQWEQIRKQVYRSKYEALVYLHMAEEFAHCKSATSQSSQERLKNLKLRKEALKNACRKLEIANNGFDNGPDATATLIMPLLQKKVKGIVQAEKNPRFDFIGMYEKRASLVLPDELRIQARGEKRFAFEPEYDVDEQLVCVAERIMFTPEEIKNRKIAIRTTYLAAGAFGALAFIGSLFKK